LRLESLKDFLLYFLQVIRARWPVLTCVFFIFVEARYDFLHDGDLTTFLLVNENQSTQGLYEDVLQVSLLAVHLEVTNRHAILLHQLVVMVNEVLHSLIVLPQQAEQAITYEEVVSGGHGLKRELR